MRPFRFSFKPQDNWHVMNERLRRGLALDRPRQQQDVTCGPEPVIRAGSTTIGKSVAGKMSVGVFRIRVNYAGSANAIISSQS